MTNQGNQPIPLKKPKVKIGWWKRFKLWITRASKQVRTEAVFEALWNSFEKVTYVKFVNSIEQSTEQTLQLIKNMIDITFKENYPKVVNNINVILDKFKKETITENNLVQLFDKLKKEVKKIYVQNELKEV